MIGGDGGGGGGGGDGGGGDGGGRGHDGGDGSGGELDLRLGRWRRSEGKTDDSGYIFCSMVAKLPHCWQLLAKYHTAPLTRTAPASCCHEI